MPPRRSSGAGDRGCTPPRRGRGTGATRLGRAAPSRRGAGCWSGPRPASAPGPPAPRSRGVPPEKSPRTAVRPGASRRRTCCTDGPSVRVGSGAGTPSSRNVASTPGSSVPVTTTPGGAGGAASRPMSAATMGVVPAAARTAAATSGAGGLVTSRITSVPGSSRRAVTADSAIRPPTSSDRSRPPRPMTWLTPAPQRSSSDMASCAPVPAAATIPTTPGLTTLAKPRPTPPSIAVPAPGPIISSPRRRAWSLSATSVVDGHVVAEEEHVQVLAERLVGRQGGVLAGHRDHGHVAPGLSSDGVAQRPRLGLARGRGRRAGPRRRPTRRRRERRRGLLVGRPDDEEEVVRRRAPPSGRGATPSPCRVATFAGVAIAALAQSTPSMSSIARIPTSCTTEST